MARTSERIDEVSIQAVAVFRAEGPGYIGQVVVRRLPGQTVLLEEDVLASGRLWNRPQQAIDAACARGQQFVRMALLRQSAADRDDGAAPWDAGPGYSLAGWQFDRNGDVQLPPGLA